MEHNLPVVVIPQRSTQLLVGHISFVFLLAPQLSSLLGIDEFKSTFFSWNPANTIASVCVKKIFKKLPQRNCFSHLKKRRKKGISVYFAKNFTILAAKTCIAHLAQKVCKVIRGHSNESCWAVTRYGTQFHQLCMLYRSLQSGSNFSVCG